MSKTLSKSRKGITYSLLAVIIIIIIFVFLFIFVPKLMTWVGEFKLF